MVVAVAAVLVVLAVSWRLGALGGADLQRRRAGTAAQRLGLPADAVDAAWVRRVARRQRFVQAGVLLGLVVSLFVHAWLVPLYAGLALGAGADQLAGRPLPPGTPRVAHGTDARLDHYVPGWLLGAAVLGAACAPALAVLWAVAPRTPPTAEYTDLSTAGTFALALLSPAGLLASLALARFVVRRPQAAGSLPDLAADDAFRSQAVRDALHVTAVTSLATSWVLGLNEQEVGGGLRHVGGMLPVALLAGIALVAVLHEATGGPRHWRTRLVPA